MRQHLHSVVVSYNRLELTKQAIASYLATVTGPYSLIVVDNNSTDGTREWLNVAFLDGPHDQFLVFPENKYPGYATNRGWALAAEHTMLLHRADNDFTYLEGWADLVREQFAANERLGQLGLRTADRKSTRLNSSH